VPFVGEGERAWVDGRTHLPNMTTLIVYVSTVPKGTMFVSNLTTADEPHWLPRDRDARIVEVGWVRGGQLGASSPGTLSSYMSPGSWPSTS